MLTEVFAADSYLYHVVLNEMMRRGHVSVMVATRGLLSNNNNSIHPVEKKILMVFVVGGVSHLEIAALRSLSGDSSFPYKIIIGSTRVMNGASFLSSLQ